MDALLALIIAGIVGVLIFCRRRVKFTTLGFPTVVGLVVGALFGLFLGRLLTGLEGPIVAGSHVPWFIWRLGLVVFGALFAVGPIRQALGETFGSGPKDEEDRRNERRR